MKAAELREMSAAELTKKLADLKEELFNLRFQHAINQLDNPMRIEAVKKDIARVKTVMRANELKDAE
ncbi:MAG TPA: 50S ribosomal protein L29 [Candidatus Ruthenibacterium avium]|uniref:Large ribosomal subunit protein uL29 n=1 Tax=Candidatus Ruthenibacterium avium TaxID=2838751 RepID=A0A9D2M292_9FIRM|nr:50S ribosomal protein L29 [Candidatus Ruthenibacterium avium]